MAVSSDECCPKGYTHIDHCIPGPGISSEALKSTESLYPGCKCTESCSNPSCSCNIIYDAEKHLLDAYFDEGSPLLFECNSLCTCNPNCMNRTTQQYSYHPSLITFHTTKKGIGVRLKEAVTKGTYIGEYVGELISSSQARKCLKELDSDGSCYIVQYKEHMSNGNTLVTNIDATHKGNITRFINHSCSPNLGMIPIRSGSVLPRLCLFTCRDVAKGEEVCFSYFGRPGGDVSEVETGSKKCFCGTEKCVGYLPLEQ